MGEPGSHLGQLEPSVLPALAELGSLTDAFIAADRSLRDSLAPGTRASVAELIADVECCCSNLIEGIDLYPEDIVRARTDSFSDAESSRARQRIAAAHLRAQAHAGDRTKKAAAPYTGDFILRIHAALFSDVPAELLLLSPAAGAEPGNQRQLVPGEWRQCDVSVGLHLPPSAAAVPQLMGRFEEAQVGKHVATNLRVANAFAGHHRLNWIHPFADGNGRTSRLVTDAQLKHLGVNAAGLWSLARGFAWNRDEYMAALDAADRPCAGALDGHGNLSLTGLQEFVATALSLAIEQIRYMDALLDVEWLRKRIRLHFDVERPDLGAPAADLVLHAFVHGGVGPDYGSAANGRSDLGTAEIETAELVARLTDGGYLATSSESGVVRVAFPLACQADYFPNLFPAGAPAAA